MSRNGTRRRRRISSGLKYSTSQGTTDEWVTVEMKPDLMWKPCAYYVAVSAASSDESSPFTLSASELSTKQTEGACTSTECSRRPVVRAEQSSVEANLHAVVERPNGFGLR